MSSPIIDSEFASLEDAVQGLEFPDAIRETLELITVTYRSFDMRLHQGQLVLHRDLADDVRDVFKSLLEIGFLVYRAEPIVAYGWDDEASMAANNSSAFNYRFVMGTNRLSNHAYGRALDLNPVQNPYFPEGDTFEGCPVYPAGAKRNLTAPGTVTAEVAKLFKEKGWEWGGDCWNETRDYQHFHKLS
ncbi:MAG TPA: M15 family metallopeptidase [Candidatus Paceibacterota bacterium]|nr:M15 family metallopeptidase [Candidatus Paceibacterota bacterium]